MQQSSLIGFLALTAVQSEIVLAGFRTNQLENAPVDLHWPSVVIDKPMECESGRALDFQLPIDLFLQLMAFSAEQDLAVSDILFAAWQLTLHRFCNQPDLLIGYEFNGREHSGSPNFVERVSNYMPLRSVLEPGITFRGFIETSRE